MGSASGRPAGVTRSFWPKAAFARFKPPPIRQAPTYPAMQRYQRILFLGALFRLFIFLLMAVVSFSTEAHDQSFPLFAGSFCQKKDCALHSLVRPFVSWDGLHFLRISLSGYESLHSTAFFPLYPALLRFFRAPFLCLGACRVAATVFGSLLLSLLSFLVSAYLLYRITLVERPRHALGSLVSFCFANAALVFHSACYSEAPFTALFLVGYFCLGKGRHVAAAIAWMLCASLRSNGILFGGFFLHRLLFRGERLSFRLVLGAFLLFIPIGCYQWYVRRLFSLAGASIPYSLIQKRYWSVGFLEYWRLSNAPLFLLAAPTILASLLSIPRLTADWAVLWGFQLLHCVGWCNVQILPRLLSYLPPVYWSTAELAVAPERWKRLLAATSAAYGVVGVFAFSAFYPPA